MKVVYRMAISVVVFLALVAPAMAQSTAPAGPSRYLQIYREEVKPGKNAAHEKIETAWARASAKAKGYANYVAWVSLSGNNEAWFLSGFPSADAWEKSINSIDANAAVKAETDQLASQDTDVLTGARSLWVTYREDLSHRPGVDLPHIRYVTVTIVRIRPGHNSEFEDNRKMVKAAHEKTGLKDNHSVWQVLSGMPAGTFLIITPMKAMAEMDASTEMHGPGTAYADAVGDEGRKKMTANSSAATMSAETLIFAVNPKMSYPSKEYVAADPDFWAPKTKPAAKAAAPAKKTP